MGELLASLWIVGCIAVIIWRTHAYLKPIAIGKRAQLSMTVRDGRIHFKGKPDER